jgi:hypothetical protein
MKDVLKCLILAVVCLTPVFVMANELSGDEFAKSGVGLACAAIVYTAIKLIEKQMTGTK